MIRPPTPAPAPMPALAPMDNPSSGGELGEGPDGTELVCVFRVLCVVDVVALDSKGLGDEEVGMRTVVEVSVLVVIEDCETAVDVGLEVDVDVA